MGCSQYILHYFVKIKIDFEFNLVSDFTRITIYVLISYTEYCAGERFRASCPGNQVVVMGNAKYGRMKIGKCIDEDFGHLGCYADVLHNLDKVCSGTKSCELVVIEVNASSTTCPKHFMKYLEATFACTEGTCRTMYIISECDFILCIKFTYRF